MFLRPINQDGNNRSEREDGTLCGEREGVGGGGGGWLEKKGRRFVVKDQFVNFIINTPGENRCPNKVRTSTSCKYDALQRDVTRVSNDCPMN